MRGSLRQWSAFLAFGIVGSSAAAQEAEIKKVGESVQKAVVRMRRGDSNYEFFNGWAINNQGLVLTLWSSVCTQGPISGSHQSRDVKAKLVGVHPTRNLALLQLEMPGDFRPAPVELSSSSSGMGDPVYLCRPETTGAEPCAVASEMSPVGYPEYFWASPPKGYQGYTPKDNGGWGYATLQPGSALVNLRGQLVGVSTNTIVNGKLAIRFMPVHDLRLEAFVDPSNRGVNHTLVRDLLQMADEILDRRDRQNKRFGEPVLGPGDGPATTYLKMALAEDPGNAEIYRRLGLVVPRGVSSGRVTPQLARSLQLDPWAEGSAGSYLDLGQSIASDKSRRSDAIAVWAEGAAKFPSTAKLWEALAKGYFDSSEFLKAARATRLAGATYGSQAREMDDIYEKSKLRLTDSERAELRRLEESLRAEVRRLVEEADAARKEKKEFMTAEGRRVIFEEKAAEGKAGSDPKAARPDPTRGMTPKQVEDSFVATRLVLALEHIKEGRLKVAEGILEDLIANYPKAETTQMARDLLQTIRKQK